MKLDEVISNYIFQTTFFDRLNNNVEAKVRIYVLDGYNFAQKDLFSLSDPYLVLKCGD